MQNKTKKNTITKELKAILTNNLGNNLSNVILFGSQANNTNTKKSDYDFLIVLNNEYTWKEEKQITELCYSIDLKYDIFTDIHIISLNQIKNSIKGKDPIFYNAIQNGIYL